MTERSSVVDIDRSSALDDLRSCDIDGLRLRWRNHFGKAPPPALTRSLLTRVIAYEQQAKQASGLRPVTERLLARIAEEDADHRRADCSASAKVTEAFKSTGMDRRYPAGTILVREWRGTRHAVMVQNDGFVWNKTRYRSLSRIAREITGKSWNGHVFFGGRGKALAARRRSDQDQAKPRGARG